jgi:hypothetical protein
MGSRVGFLDFLPYEGRRICVTHINERRRIPVPVISA